MSSPIDLFRMMRIIQKAREIKNDPERRDKSVRYGVSSIISAVLTPVFGLIFFAVPWFFEGEGMLYLVLGIAVAAIGAGGILISFVQAVFYMALQFYVKRKPIAWIALASIAVCLGATVFIVITALSA